MTKSGIYEHYKGGRYRVLFRARTATNGRDGLIDVVYIDLKNGGLHTRDETEFNERVWVEGESKGKVCTLSMTDELYKVTRERFRFVGTMGNEMSDKHAEELYDDLHATFTGRKPAP